VKIGKYQLHNHTKRYIDVLGDIVDGYNNSVHSTIEITPNEASSSLANRQIALFNLNKNLNLAPAKKRWKKAEISQGDVVRIPILPVRRFKKSHEPSFTPEVFVVDEAALSDKHRPFARFLNQGRSLLTRGALKRSYFYANELSPA
ncbi:hypothetical protein DLS47_12925, partial [Staphylococcus pseudintermedius]